jgi:hypothetical protein
VPVSCSTVSCLTQKQELISMETIIRIIVAAIIG